MALVTSSGIVVPGLSWSQFQKTVQTLSAEFSITSTQAIEAAALSWAMAVRYALGLSSADAKVCGCVSDSFGGAVTLATLRHLHNNGAKVHAVFFLDPQNHSNDIAEQGKPLEKAGVPLDHGSVYGSAEVLESFFSEFHAILYGAFDFNSNSSSTGLIHDLVAVLNELSVPVHCVGAPGGLSLTDGALAPPTLVANSTLGLGLPLAIAETRKDYFGRYYLADISLPPELRGKDLPPLFTDQPVMQLKFS